MLDKNPCRLYSILTCSYAHLRSFELKAYFKATIDMHFDGLPNKYSNHSMTRMQGSRYLMHAQNIATLADEAYCVDVDSLTAERLVLDIEDVSGCFIEGEYMLVVRYDNPMAISRDLKEIGQIESNAKYEHCKNGFTKRGRNAQQADRSIYFLDKHACLCRIEWQNIEVGKYCKTMMKSNVRHFYVDKELGLATLNLDHTLSLPCLIVVDLKAKIDSEAKWNIVTYIATYRIVCGDRDIDGQAIMASISRHGVVISTLRFKLTSNGYKIDMFAGIYSLHQAYTRGRRGIMLAIERDGCCHLISVANGRMSKLQSIASIVNVDRNENKSEWIVTSVTATGSEGEFIVGGYGWTKRISLKLK